MDGSPARRRPAACVRRWEAVCVGQWRPSVRTGQPGVAHGVSFEGIGGPQGQAGRMFSTSPGQTLSASSTARRYVLGSL